MSRADQSAVKDTAAAENSTYTADATKAFADASGDISNYSDATNAFKAANPYVAGGAVQTADNQEVADTAAGSAEAAGQAIQGAAVRTGQNPGGAIAATEQMQQANERALVGQEAANTKDTAAADASYAGAALDATGKVQSMQDQLATQQAQAAQGALGTEEEAAKQPSFLDELGSGLTGAAATLGSAAINRKH